MVALLDLEDVITIVGRSPNSAAEAAQWQFHIEAISAYISSYVDVSFEVKTGDVVRYEADYHGVIDLGGDPVSTVTSVKDWQSQTDVTYYWNGLDQLFGLNPNQVVDVTYTHGYSTVPSDIRYLATEAVVGILGLGATGSLTSFTVGDVTEVYSDPAKQGVTVVQLATSVLDRYSNTYGSWRLGRSYQTGGSINGLPIIN